MSVIRRVFRLGRPVQLALVFVFAFALGGGAVAGAAAAGVQIGSLFYISQTSGNPTTPCNTVGGSSPTTTCFAIVDSSGNLHVTGTSTVSGTVAVSNFPADQQVHGSVNVGNLPTDGDGNLKVAPQGTQDVNVVGGIAGLPIATRGQSLFLNLGPLSSHIFHVNMKVTHASVDGCSRWHFELSGGGELTIVKPGQVSFPIPLDVTTVTVNNVEQFGCLAATDVIGY